MLSPRHLAVVAGRGGPLGAQQVLSTLESLVGEWSETVSWRLLLLLVDDRSSRDLVASLGGDFEVAWDVDDVSHEVQRRREADEQVHLLHGGDAAPRLSEAQEVLLVPLVDTMGVDVSGRPNRSLTSLFPEDHVLQVVWEREVRPDVRHDVVVFTNLSLGEAARYRAARRIAWLVESPDVYPETSASLVEDSTLFDLVITSDAALARRLPRAAVLPAGGCWIPPTDQRIHPKSRWCSMLLSTKRTLAGQQLRHTLVPLAKGVDLFGRGAPPPFGAGPVSNKADALRDHRFSIAIENCSREGYFSEKLIDCFVTGTIPVYWGAPDVGDVFDSAGVLAFQGPEDFRQILDRATPEFYESRRDAVEANFHTALGFRAAEQRLAPLLRSFFP